jgi:hypothetical protein
MAQIMKTRPWKIIVLFVLAFATMGLPVAVSALLEFLGPPPYLLHEDRLGPEWSQARTDPDGSTVIVHRYADAAAAEKGAGALADSIPWSSRTKTPEVVRYTRRDDRRYGLLLPVENRVIQIEAGEYRTIDQRLASLPFVSENPEKNVMSVIFTDHPTVFFVGMAVYVLLWFAFVSRGATWAATVRPRPGASPAPEQTLRDRLLAINTLNLPFQMREQPRGRLLAEWRIADVNWAGILQAGQLSVAHRIYMQMDTRAGRVRILERHRGATWSGGIGGTGRSWSFFQGITFFQYQQGMAAGLLFKHGRWTRTPYNYSYNLAEMKNPLIEVIVGSGWTFAPVATFFRPLGG